MPERRDLEQMVGRGGLEPPTSALDRGHRCASETDNRRWVHRCSGELSGVLSFDNVFLGYVPFRSCTTAAKPNNFGQLAVLGVSDVAYAGPQT